MSDFEIISSAHCYDEETLFKSPELLRGEFNNLPDDEYLLLKDRIFRIFRLGRVACQRKYGSLIPAKIRSKEAEASAQGYGDKSNGLAFLLLFIWNGKGVAFMAVTALEFLSYKTADSSLNNPAHVRALGSQKEDHIPRLYRNYSGIAMDSWPVWGLSPCPFNGVKFDPCRREIESVRYG